MCELLPNSSVFSLALLIGVGLTPSLAPALLARSGPSRFVAVPSLRSPCGEASHVVPGSAVALGTRQKFVCGDEWCFGCCFTVLPVPSFVRVHDEGCHGPVFSFAICQLLLRPLAALRRWFNPYSLVDEAVTPCLLQLSAAMLAWAACLLVALFEVYFGALLDANLENFHRMPAYLDLVSTSVLVSFLLQPKGC